MTVRTIEWIGTPPELPAELHVKIRYRQADQKCRLTQSEHGYEISLSEPQRAVTPGQWACFYDGDICLGGGIIIDTDNPL